MNAIPNRPLYSLPACALAAAIALSFGACKRDPDVAPPPMASTEPPPAPTEPSHDLKPANGAVEPTEANVESALEQLDAGAKAARAQWRGKTFEEFEAAVFKEPGEHGKYIVSGDLAIADRKHLEEFFKALQQEDDETAHGKLTVRALAAAAGVNGGVDIWTSQRKKRLTYCVANGFAGRKPAVLADMQAATLAWEQAANVDFIHLAAQDANCTASNPNVEFDVRPIDVDGEYLARAFFPADPRADRNVLIDNSAFEIAPDDTLKLVGILRHELGHALGLRHEHTRPEAGTCFEDSDFVPITVYDEFSVMHYPQCNGGGDWSLQLTALDRAGSACLYGKGSGNTEDLAQCVFRAPDAPATGTTESRTFENQSVAKDERKQYAAIAVKPGSIATVKMTGVGASAGDPDLYVRYLGPPDTARWNCRPYLSHANESCELEVPANRNRIHVMVRGYAAGSYRLEITYTKP